MTHPFCHVELSSTNVPAAKDFYRKLFQWKLTDVPMADYSYTMVDVGKGTGGGMMPQLIPNAGSAWMPYMLVDDIDASTKKVKQLGGTVMKDVTEIMGMGWLSIAEDPTGAIFGLWKPRGPAPKAKKAKVKAAARKKPKAALRKSR